MRRPARVAWLGVAAVATATALGLAIPAQAATNTITNPGFETGNLSGWSCDSADSVVTGHAHTGTYALAGAADNGSTAQCNQTVPVAANTSYTLTASVNGNYVYLGVSGAVTASNWTPSTGGAYAQLSVTFNTGTATSITVYLHGWYAQGTYYADDATIKRTRRTQPPPPPPPAPHPPAPPAPAPAPPARGARVRARVRRGAESEPDPDHRAAAGAAAQARPHRVLAGLHQPGPGTAAVRRADQLRPRRGGLRRTRPDPGRGRPSASTPGCPPPSAATPTPSSRRTSRPCTRAARRSSSRSAARRARSRSATPPPRPTSPTRVHALMQQYGFDGVDIDLENGAQPDLHGAGAAALRAKVGANLIITMAPQTIDMQSTGGGYFKLALYIKDILTVVNTQYYNSGSMLGCDQMAAYRQGTVNFMTALACIQLQNGLRPDQVGLGLPAVVQRGGRRHTSAPAKVNARWTA